jgi:hypothetical protein
MGTETPNEAMRESIGHGRRVKLSWNVMTIEVGSFARFAK